MKAYRITISEWAIADILEQAEWYEAQSDSSLGEKWEAAVTSTVVRISQFPETGALCEFSAPNLRGTRRLAVEQFSRQLIFYRILESEILILRVVHGARDLETLFGG